MFYSKQLKENKKDKTLFLFKETWVLKRIYKSLNCGKGSKDNKKVRKNLNFVAKKMGVKNNKLILMHQTHSNRVIEINKNNYKKKLKLMLL